jgi:hypothetical protein
MSNETMALKEHPIDLHELTQPWRSPDDGLNELWRRG